MTHITEEMDYRLEKMPNGEFVGEVYYLTHEVIKNLGCNPDNDQFCSAEKTIREYVWKACKRAALLAPAQSVKGGKDE